MKGDNSLNYDDPAVEETWCEERRREVAAYLRKQELTHGQVGEWPAWHVPPVVSIWAIESASVPGAMGWWVICGDLPTDHLSAENASDPRDAVRSFAARWRSAAETMRDGRTPETINVGQTAEERRVLAPLLESRAELLRKWAERDDVWEELFGED